MDDTHPGDHDPRDRGRTSGDPDGAEENVIGEARWPMAAAVITAIVLTLLMPDEVRHFPRWFVPSLEGALLIALVLGDPGAINRRTRWLRNGSIALVAILVLGALWSTGLLIEDLITGGPTTNSASELLEAGAFVWSSTIIAFSLLYWQLDGGGAAARAHHLPEYPDFAFPQQLNPELAPPNWRPQYVDYLYLGFTNATAFSPTDAMPLAPWAKIAMSTQALASLAILGLVIARAVNVFS
jgi:hypothetical protein